MKGLIAIVKGCLILMIIFVVALIAIPETGRAADDVPVPIRVLVFENRVGQTLSHLVNMCVLILGVRAPPTLRTRKIITVRLSVYFLTGLKGNLGEKPVIISKSDKSALFKTNIFDWRNLL